MASLCNVLVPILQHLSLWPWPDQGLFTCSLCNTQPPEGIKEGPKPCLNRLVAVLSFALDNTSFSCWATLSVWPVSPRLARAFYVTVLRYVGFAPCILNCHSLSLTSLVVLRYVGFAPYILNYYGWSGIYCTHACLGYLQICLSYKTSGGNKL
jgi:hypothetical protein